MNRVNDRKELNINILLFLRHGNRAGTKRITSQSPADKGNQKFASRFRVFPNPGVGGTIAAIGDGARGALEETTLFREGVAHVRND